MKQEYSALQLVIVLPLKVTLTEVSDRLSLIAFPKHHALLWEIISVQHDINKMKLAGLKGYYYQY